MSVEEFENKTWIFLCDRLNINQYIQITQLTMNRIVPKYSLEKAMK